MSKTPGKALAPTAARLPPPGRPVWVRWLPDRWTREVVGATMAGVHAGSFCVANNFHEFFEVDEGVTWLDREPKGGLAGWPLPGQSVWVRTDRDPDRWREAVVVEARDGQCSGSFCVEGYSQSFFWLDRRVTWLERDPKGSASEREACWLATSSKRDLRG